jgi:ferredoxin
MPAVFAVIVQLTGFIRPMPVIKFVKEKKEIEVPSGTNLRHAALSAGINLYQGLNGFGAGLNKYLNCHGLGMCGMCRVLVTKGMEHTSPAGAMERLRFRCPVPDPLPCLAFVGHEDTMRLACKTSVHGDVEVETGPPIDLFGENFFS